MDAKSDFLDLPALAREQVQVGPTPEWVSPIPYDPDFEPQVRGPATYLLIEQQVNAEEGKTFIRTAMRLETMQAVQHQSQWRLEFEPQTQSIVLHSIKIRRGTNETEHGHLDRIRFLQREAELEGCVIDGWITLLLLLEDVCPGDILEWSYTLTNRPRLLPDNISSFFTLPIGTEIGKHHFSIRFAERRALKWISSSPELAPTITTEGDSVRWFWLGEKTATPELEDHTPAWHLIYPWIQVSDCADWQTVSRAVLEGWKEESGEGLTKFIQEIQSFSADPLVRVSRALELVQDSFRYLSVNLELGGQIPAAPESVMRRRYGDCKDLAFLLVQVLRLLGISARPVLVNAIWRNSIGTMLPSPGIFNHVVVEYQMGDEKRWVDATLKAQGGGALGRRVPDFGLGLPIDVATTALAPVPAASLPSGSVEIKESILLDTSGNPSFLAQIIVAKGDQADSVRWEFANLGAEVIAKRRLQACANKYSRAARVGLLQHRDDREINEFTVSEVFEIDGFLKRDGDHTSCVFFIQSEVTAGMLLSPPPAPRRNAFSIPYPYHAVHTIEIDFTGMNSAPMPVYRNKNDTFTFSRRVNVLPKFFKVTFALETQTDAIAPGRVQEHRKQVEAVWLEASIQMRFPVGYARMRKRSDFGALPSPTRPAPSAILPPREHKPILPATPANNPLETLPNKPETIAPPSGTTASAGEKSAIFDRKPSARERVTRSSTQRPSRKHSRQINRRCLHSLIAVLGALVVFLIAGLFSSRPEFEVVASLLFLAVIAAVTWSLVLAVLGWRECARSQDKYRHGPGLALATLIIGGLFGLFLFPVFVRGIIAFVTRSPFSGQTSNAKGPLKFETKNFVFQPPGPPWSQTDARMFGSSPVLAFVRPEPMFLTITATPLEKGFPDALGRLVELSKATVRNDTVSCTFISEGGVKRNGLEGWQMEIRGNFQGRDYFVVYWLVAKNGFGYQLVVGGASNLESQVKDQANDLFGNFQITVPQN